MSEEHRTLLTEAGIAAHTPTATEATFLAELDWWVEQHGHARVRQMTTSRDANDAPTGWVSEARIAARPRHPQPHPRPRAPPPPGLVDLAGLPGPVPRMCGFPVISPASWSTLLLATDVSALACRPGLAGPIGPLFEPVRAAGNVEPDQPQVGVLLAYRLAVPHHQARDSERPVS